MKEKTSTGRNSLILLLAAIIWGTAFVSQSVGAEHLGPLHLTRSGIPWARWFWCP